MKLYDVPRKTKIKFEGEALYFYHTDGMYSYCQDKDGNVVHLVAWAEVEIIK